MQRAARNRAWSGLSGSSWRKFLDFHSQQDHHRQWEDGIWASPRETCFCYMITRLVTTAWGGTAIILFYNTVDGWIWCEAEAGVMTRSQWQFIKLVFFAVHMLSGQIAKSRWIGSWKHFARTAAEHAEINLTIWILEITLHIYSTLQFAPLTQLRNFHFNHHQLFTSKQWEAGRKRECHKQTFITHEINFHCGNETFDRLDCMSWKRKPERDSKNCCFCCFQHNNQTCQLIFLSALLWETIVWTFDMFLA